MGAHTPRPKRTPLALLAVPLAVALLALPGGVCACMEHPCHQLVTPGRLNVEPRAYAQTRERTIKVLVTGSRGWGNRGIIRDRLAELPATALVIVGGAKGADKLAEEEALNR